MSRCIGIRHRRKETAEGKLSPTCVTVISPDEKTVTYNLKNDTAELDFMLGRFPIKWRKLALDEELNLFDRENNPQGFRPHHCKWHIAKKDEDLTNAHPSQFLQIKKGQTLCFTEVPTDYEGPKQDDKVGMILGGSGDRFAAALSRCGDETGYEVYRIPPYVFSELRGGRNKEQDQLLLAELIGSKPELFYRVLLRDRQFIRIKEAYDLRMDALKSEIACGQRIVQRQSGKIFLSEEGRYPEGTIEDQYDEAKANDTVYCELAKERKKRERELEQCVKATPIWDRIFEPIEGCGPRLAAGLIAPIGDIRRFWVEPDSIEMDRLKQEIADHKKLGDFEAGKSRVRHLLESDMDDYHQLDIVAAWQRQNGKEQEAAELDQAGQCHRQRSKLRRKARERGKAKLKKFCGVHVLNTDENGNLLPPNKQFPRRRHGAVANWNPVTRQTLYLLAEQFNRRPDSTWGKRLVTNKRRQRELHPEVIEEEVKVKKNGNSQTKTVKRFTDGHILKRAHWRTLSQFVCYLFDEWTKFELEQNGSE